MRNYRDIKRVVASCKTNKRIARVNSKINIVHINKGIGDEVPYMFDPNNMKNDSKFKIKKLSILNRRHMY